MARAADRTRRPPRASVWLDGKTPRGGSGRRTDQPSGLDRDRITEATVRLLDAEGLGRFSMRHLAAELSVTAMSVYWYVDTKDDLLELALDAAIGELSLPSTSEPSDWREQLRSLATEYRALLVRHPWLSPLAGTFLNIGPHAMDLSVTIQRIIRGTGLPSHGQSAAVSAVFQFVYGFGTIEGHFIQRCAEAGMTQDEYVNEAMNSIAARPELAGWMREAADLVSVGGERSVAEVREAEFEFALDLLVAGIEAMVARA